MNKDNSVLVTNWNNNQEIVSKVLQVSFNKRMGKMYCFDAVGFNEETNQSGNDFYFSIWLPEDQFSVIKEIIY